MFLNFSYVKKNTNKQKMDILKKIGILGKGDKLVNPNEKIYANIYKSTVFIQNT